MDTKWKRSRAALGFLAFFCGITLVLHGALFLVSGLADASARQYAADSFQADWHNTQQVRDMLSRRLRNLIRIAAGEVQLNQFFSSWGSRRTGADLLEGWTQDKNILFFAQQGAQTAYRNSDELAPAQDEPTAPEGYGLVLSFDGESTRVWLNGRELDVYGTGYYDFEGTGQWLVPGYRNYPAEDGTKDVRVVLALIDRPQMFALDGTIRESAPYQVWQGLQRLRAEYLRSLAWLAIGAALLAGYVLLRKDKARADRLLARGTGKVWFEVKIAVLLLLAAALLSRMGPLGWDASTWPAETPADSFYPDLEAEVYYTNTNDWGEVTAIYGSGLPAERIFGTAEYTAALGLRDALVELAGYPGWISALFWAVYLLLVNDWRYNKRPWRRSICSALIARDLKLPVQRRLNQAAQIAVLGAAVPLCLLLYMVFVWNENWGYEPVTWCLFGFSAVFALLPVLFAQRLRRLWEDLGAVSAQAAAIRAGGLGQELALAERSDLRPLADDLNHVQQGLRQAVEDRTRSERMKVELVTNVSHDLKTPLTSILSYAELLEREGLEPPAGEYVRILGEKARRLSAMVQDVFEVSKAASGQLPVKLERLDYARLLRQTLADMDGNIAASGLALRASIPEEPVFITADSDRLYRVFQNLLGNALKYSLAGSRVYLTLTAEGGMACAVLRNTSADELRPGADYTARFVRGDASRTDGGSGLGLSIAGSFARACGGDLTVTTDADLFTAKVSFPLAGEG